MWLHTHTRSLCDEACVENSRQHSAESLYLHEDTLMQQCTLKCQMLPFWKADEWSAMWWKLVWSCLHRGLVLVTLESVPFTFREIAMPIEHDEILARKTISREKIHTPSLHYWNVKWANCSGCHLQLCFTSATHKSGLAAWFKKLHHVLPSNIYLRRLGFRRSTNFCNGMWDSVSCMWISPRVVDLVRLILNKVYLHKLQIQWSYEGVKPCNSYKILISTCFWVIS